MKIKHLLTLQDLTPKEINDLIELAVKIKSEPADYYESLKNRTLLMIFERESLRTRLSFETAMTQLGGYAIFLNVKDTPLGEKESIEDAIRCASRNVDIIMARIRHKILEVIAKESKVPVINAMTDFTHPCQILSDFLTILEKKKQLRGLKMTYIGDSNNNTTHSLLFGCPKVGINLVVACPQQKDFAPQSKVLKIAKVYARKYKTKVEVTENQAQAVKDADIVYTDTWISYYIPKEIREVRKKVLKRYQVNQVLLKKAKRNVIFMHCLPALRGQEVTASVIDGPRSVVYDQAENRLHIQKALLLTLLEAVK